MIDEDIENGGVGSGNFGHAGRPGKIGGSSPYEKGYSKPKREAGQKLREAIAPEREKAKIQLQDYKQLYKQKSKEHLDRLRQQYKQEYQKTKDYLKEQDKIRLKEDKEEMYTGSNKPEKKEVRDKLAELKQQYKDITNKELYRHKKQYKERLEYIKQTDKEKYKKLYQEQKDRIMSKYKEEYKKKSEEQKQVEKPKIKEETSKVEKQTTKKEKIKLPKPTKKQVIPYINHIKREQWDKENKPYEALIYYKLPAIDSYGHPTWAQATETITITKDMLTPTKYGDAITTEDALKALKQKGVDTSKIIGFLNDD